MSDKKRKSVKLKLVAQNPDDEADEVCGYLYLPNHPQDASKPTFRTVRLQDLYSYNGWPDIYLDFDEQNRIIGIELA